MKISIISCAILGCLLILPAQGLASEQAASSAVENLQLGQQAFNDGDHALAFNLWHSEAKRGNAEAQVFVGLAYANGWGVKKDLTSARNWYEKSANNNNPSGQMLLGLYLIQQDEQNFRAVGLSWLRLAARQGEPMAQRFLDKGYAKGWFQDIMTSKPELEPDAVTLAKRPE